jgi:hypothetical protein
MNDQIDSAIRKMKRNGKTSGHVPPAAMTFKPFDPELKMPETTAFDHGREIRVIKGAPMAVGAFAPITIEAAAELGALDRAGYRTLAVGAGPSAEFASGSDHGAGVGVR